MSKIVAPLHRWRRRLWPETKPKPITATAPQETVSIEETKDKLDEPNGVLKAGLGQSIPKEFWDQ